MTFDVLGTQRAIRDDKGLSSTEAWLLICAVLRTDNKTSKVRYSLEGLADDAKVSRKTALRAFKEPEVLKYFSKVERNSRSVNLWFADIEALRDMVSLNEPEEVEGHEVTQPTIEGHGVHFEGHCVPVEGHEVTPSTLSSTLSSTDASASAPAFPLQEEDKGEAVTESVETSSLSSEETRLSSFLDREARRQDARDSEMARLEEAEENVSEEELERRALSKDERETYRICTNRKRMTHLEAIDHIQSLREVEEVW